VQEVGGSEIGIDVFLDQFEPHAWRISIAALNIVDGYRDARFVGEFGGNSFTQIGSEGRNAALPRQVITDEGNPISF